MNEIFENLIDEFHKSVLAGAADIVAMPASPNNVPYFKVHVGADNFITFKKGNEVYFLFGTNTILNEFGVEDLYESVEIQYSLDTIQRLKLERLATGDYGIKWNRSTSS